MTNGLAAIVVGVGVDILCRWCSCRGCEDSRRWWSCFRAVVVDASTLDVGGVVIAAGAVVASRMEGGVGWCGGRGSRQWWSCRCCFCYCCGGRSLGEGDVLAAADAAVVGVGELRRWQELSLLLVMLRVGRGGV